MNSAGYLSVFKISFKQEFAYRLNFIMWRVRNVIQIFVVFYLWETVFTASGMTLFGYDKPKILTYVFGLIIVRAFVLSARAVDVAGEIARGDLNNYLVKPIDYFKYWLTRDLASKALNLFFAFFETLFLLYILKPPFFIQTNPVLISAFLVSLVFAMLIFFCSLFIVSAVPFWTPEAAWGAQFLFSAILVEFLSGALFPLDVLPIILQRILSFLPFQYLIYFPIQVYLGKVQGQEVIKGILVSGMWVLILYSLMKIVWRRGLKSYDAYGR